MSDRWKVKKGDLAGIWRVYRGDSMIAAFEGRTRAFNYAREQAVRENLSIVSLEICS